MNGFIKIDKEEDFTSRDIDNILKKRFHESKVGHLGTLDPFATGLLIVAIGDATKMLPYFKDEKKTYLATLKLGESKDSSDKTGNTIKKENIKEFTKEDILSVFSSFIGKQKQMPPKYSAKWVNGVRAYQLTREGVDVKLNEQDIEIYSLDLISFSDDTITFKACVSKGTYIRVLGEDIACRLNNIGYLESLRRLNIEDYDLNNSVKVFEAKESDIISIQSIFPLIKEYTCYGKVLSLANNGNPLYLNGVSDDLIFLKNDHDLIALYKKKEERYYPLCIFNNGKKTD